MIIYNLFKNTTKMLSGYGIGKIYPLPVILPKVYKYFYHNFHPKVDKIQGHIMHLDNNDFLGLAISGVHEPLETEIFRRDIKPGYVVLDIGANIGYYSLIASDLVGDTGKVYAFEPSPHVYSLLEDNIKDNMLFNVVPLQLAISDKTGVLNFEIYEANEAGHRIATSESKNVISVESVRLDDYFKGYDGKIDFIKMDIEGSELLAFKGMQETIKRNKNIKIIMEFCPVVIHDIGLSSEEFLTTLVNSGFTLYDINEKTNAIELTSKEELLTKYTIENQVHTNLYLVKTTEKKTDIGL